MALKVVDADRGDVQRIRQTGADAGTDKQGAREPGSRGIRHSVQFRWFLAGPTEDFPGERQHSPDMVAGGEFGHDPAIIGMQGNLGMQGVGEQPLVAIVESYAGFVAGSFDTKY